MSITVSRKMNVVVNDRPYVVEVGDLATRPISVCVNGRPYRVQLEERLAQQSSAPADAVSAPAATGRPIVASVSGPQPMAPAVESRASEVRAPMPGSIVGLYVRQGDTVAVGQQLCTLEAMKMKNAIRSSRNGVIGRVEVGEGQAVAHGDVLFTFE